MGRAAFQTFTDVASIFILLEAMFAVHRAFGQTTWFTGACVASVFVFLESMLAFDGTLGVATFMALTNGTSSTVELEAIGTF